MWYITGGCHHSLDCEKWLNACSDCFLIHNSFLNNLCKSQFKDKINLFCKYDNVRIITPSNWLSSLSKQSPILKSNKIFTIPNTLNTTTFQPIPRNIARNMLGLPVDKRIIMFGADCGSKNPYKGWNDFARLINKLDPHKYEVITMGSSSNVDLKSLNLKINSFGKITDELTLALLYNASDVFVSPTLIESFGLTILEAISCGTPSVAYSVGGVVDIINHKVNGYLCDVHNIDDLSNGVYWAIDKSDDVAFREKIHKDAEKKFSYHRVANSHITLWGSV